jgi:hypothetical protein|tara:strand:- start:1006 stop:1119 length:114 start_codon:yes stop_codon:yes gene_type:complete
VQRETAVPPVFGKEGIEKVVSAFYDICLLLEVFFILK